MGREVSAVVVSKNKCQEVSVVVVKTNLHALGVLEDAQQKNSHDSSETRNDS